MQAKNSQVSKLTLFGLIALCLAAFVGGISSSIYMPAVLHMQQSLHTNAGEIKLLITAFLIGVSGGSLLVGILSEVYMTKRVYVISFIFYTIATLVCVFTSDVHVFMAMRVIQGVGAVAGATLSLAIVTRYLTGKEFKIAMYTIVACISFGPAVAPTVGGLILDFVDSWRFLFSFLTFLIFINTILLYFYLPSRKNDGTTLKNLFLTQMKPMLWNPYFWAYCALAGFGFGSFFLFLSLSPYIFIKTYHWTHSDFAYIGLASALGMSGGSFFKQIFLPKWKPMQAIQLGLIIAILSSLSIILLHAFTTLKDFEFLTLAAIVLLGCGILATGSITLAMEQTRKISGAGAAFLISIKIGLSSIITLFVPIIPEKANSMGGVFFLLAFCASLLYYMLKSLGKNRAISS